MELYLHSPIRQEQALGQFYCIVLLEQVQTVTSVRIVYLFAPKISRIQKLPEVKLGMANGMNFIVSFFYTVSNISSTSYLYKPFLFHLQFSYHDQADTSKLSHAVVKCHVNCQYWTNGILKVGLTFSIYGYINLFFMQVFNLKMFHFGTGLVRFVQFDYRLGQV